MPEYINLEKLELSDDYFKLAILEEIQKHFKNEAILNEWQAYLSEEINKASHTHKKHHSFDLLCEIVRSLLVNQKITRENLRDTFENHHRYILDRIEQHLNVEFHVSENESMNENTVDFAKNEGYFVSSMDFQFHLVRNIVTTSKHFSTHDNGLYQTEIKDAKGKVHGLARINTVNDFELTMNEEEQEYWNKLRSAVHSMDEMTADIFDIICFLYLFAPKDKDGFLYFHSNDALKLRSEGSRSEVLEVRQRDRFNIMSRIKALSNIWISLKEGDIIEIDDENEFSTKYKYRDWQRMFEIGKVRAAYDNNDQFLGIYACQIKPTSLLTSFLNENKRLGLIDLSALEFHPIRQRYEKRLVRYLSIQWFIRLSKNNLTQSFRVRTLIQEMDFPSRARGIDIYERFIEALNELQSKGIISNWNFTEEIDLSKLGKKGWIPYFYGLKIIITPSRETIEKNKRKLSILESHYKANEISVNHILDTIDQEANLKNKPTTQGTEKKKKIKIITPEIIIQERKRRNLSVLKAANEIGIGYNTLKRFEDNITKRRNKNNDEKILNWLKRSQTFSEAN